MATTTKRPLEAWAAFLHAHAAVVEAVEADVRSAHGLGLTEYEVLVRLEDAPAGRIRMRELAELALLSKSGLTRLVERMEDAGLLQRTACPSDRRGTFAEISSAGRRALNAARGTVEAAVERHFVSVLDADEASCLLDAFRRLLQRHNRSIGLRACGGNDTAT